MFAFKKLFIVIIVPSALSSLMITNNVLAARDFHQSQPAHMNPGMTARPAPSFSHQNPSVTVHQNQPASSVRGFSGNPGWHGGTSHFQQNQGFHQQQGAVWHGQPQQSQQQQNTGWHQNAAWHGQQQNSGWHGHGDHHDDHHRGNVFFSPFSQVYPIFNPYYYPYYYGDTDNTTYTYSAPETTNETTQTTTITYTGAGENQYPNGTWVTASNGDVPGNAVVYSNENGNTTYYCRASYNNQIFYGELIPNDGCYARDQSVVMRFDSYDVLTS